MNWLYTKTDYCSPYLLLTPWNSQVHLSLEFCFLNLVLHLFISKLQTAQDMDADTIPIYSLNINFKSQVI